MNRYVVVADDGIDPRDLDEVIWAVSRKTRCARAEWCAYDHRTPRNLAACPERAEEEVSPMAVIVRGMPSSPFLRVPA
jgi:3-octaprenyl-4-hydroxybenzoate carboxy-lyase